MESEQLKSNPFLANPTEQMMRLAKAQVDDYVKKGLDPVRGAEAIKKIYESAKGEKYQKIEVHNASSVLKKPLMLRKFDGIATGLEELDKNYLFGIKPGDVICVAGASGVGKSSMTACWSMAMSKAGVSVLTYNFEDGEEEFESRLQLLARGNGYTEEDLKNYRYYGMEQMAPFYNDPNELIYAIRASVAAIGVKVVVIDMINDLVKVNTADQADDLIRAINILAKELKIAIIFTAKLRKSQGLSVQMKMTEKYCPTSEAVAGFNSLEFYATKIITISKLPQAVLPFVPQKSPLDATHRPFAVHVAKNRRGDTTIDYGGGYVCQWLFYNDKTVLDQKGLQKYDYA